MRTTINLDEQLIAQAKQLAAESGRTLTAVLEDALRERLARRDRIASRTRVELHPGRARASPPGYLKPAVP